MAVSIQDIKNWLAANPLADDLTIAAAMNQYGVTPAQMAQATGLSAADVQARYNAALELKSARPTPTTPTPQQTPPPAPVQTTPPPAPVQTQSQFSPEQIQAAKNFFATNPSADQIYATASQLGLTTPQLAQIWAESTGGSYDDGLNAIQGYLSSTGKTLSGTPAPTTPAPTTPPAPATRTPQATTPPPAPTPAPVQTKSQFSPDQIKAAKDFFATNPSADQIYAAANNLGLTTPQLAQIWAESTGGNYNDGMNAIQGYLSSTGKTLSGTPAPTTPPVRPTPQPPAPPVKTGSTVPTTTTPQATTPAPVTPPPPAAQPVTNAAIQNWLQQNPTATDAQIAAAMNQYNVSPAQMAAATGTDLATVQQRYNAASPTGQFFTTTPATNTTGTGTTSLTGPASTGTSGGGGNVLSGLVPSQQQQSQQSIAPYAQPYVGSMLGATMGQLFNTDQSGNITSLRGYTPYSYNPADYYAAFTPLQQNVMNSAANMQQPGQYNAATNLSSTAGLQALNAALAAQNYGAQAAGAGQQYAQQATNPYAIGAYMNPYMQNVVDVQSNEARRQAAISAQAQQAQAAQAGAFGGARDIIQRQQNDEALQRTLANIQATGSQNAYNQALQNMQFGASLGLQGLQGGLQGLSGAQTGFSNAGQQATNLSNIGTAQNTTNLANLGFMNTVGQQQQQQQQNIINQAVQNYQTAQQYPYMQLGFMQNMMQGLPVQTTSQQTYAAPPNKLAQLAGAGTGLYALGQMLGGTAGLSGALSSLGDTASSAFNTLGNAASSGFNTLTSALGFGAEGGTTDDIMERGSKPSGLAALAISKM